MQTTSAAVKAKSWIFNNNFQHKLFSADFHQKKPTVGTYGTNIEM